MKNLEVALGDRSYPIYIGSGLISRVGEIIGGLPLGEKVLVVSNRTVGALFADTLMNSLAECGKKASLVLIEDGEIHKTLATAQYLYDQAFAAGLDRGCPIIALGGGVVGDLAGFVAATYLRGIPFVQVPTTLLAQVDSSVGGKVAVNHPQGKNIIGAFYQPVCVLADVDLLRSLPRREWSSGLAEVIKYGVIRDAGFFGWLEENVDRLFDDPDGISYMVEQCCRIKAEVVALDEKENGLRAVLNFGHTVGHAVETLCGYGSYTHGEAVSIGMAAAGRLAVAMGLFDAASLERLVGLLGRAGLPLKIPAELQAEDMITAMYHDKKAVDGRLAFVLPVDIGRVIVDSDVEPGLVGEIIGCGF